MSLKEEISELLVYETFDDYTKANLFTYQIIKEIEKRIDDKIRLVEDRITNTGTFYDGVYTALNQVKEMLK